MNNKNEENLFVAVRYDRKDQINNLIDKVDINYLDIEKANLLQAAIVASNQQSDLCEDLIKRGVNINNQDYRGQTVLHYIALYKNIEIAKILLRSGASLDIEDSYGNQPLWTAVFHAKGEYDLVNLYLEHGADSNHKNKVDKSPLDLAKQFGDEKLIKILSKK